MSNVVSSVAKIPSSDRLPGFTSVLSRLLVDLGKELNL